MPKASYPAGSDLEARLRGASVDPDIIEGIKEETPGIFDDAIAGAIAEWESVTGWRPYLAAAAQTVTMPAPTMMRSGGIVLSGRLALTPAVFAVTAVTLNGRTLQAGIDYRPGPTSAGLTGGGMAGNPFCWFDFNTSFAIAFPTFPMSQYIGPISAGSTPPTVAITGRFGKIDQIPDDVWDCIIKNAQTSIAGEVALAITEGTIERKVGDVTKKFAGTGSDGPLDWPTKLWGAKFERVSKRETRVVF